MNKFNLNGADMKSIQMNGEFKIFASVGDGFNVHRILNNKNSFKIKRLNVDDINFNKESNLLEYNEYHKYELDLSDNEKPINIRTNDEETTNLLDKLAYAKSGDFTVDIKKNIPAYMEFNIIIEVKFKKNEIDVGKIDDKIDGNMRSYLREHQDEAKDYALERLEDGIAKDPHNAKLIREYGKLYQKFLLKD